MLDQFNSCPLTVIAGIFNATEVEVQRLATTGIIPKPDNGQYDLVACVRSYITHLRDNPYANHAELCRLLDMSEANLKNVLRLLDIDYRTTPKLEILKAYIRDIREKAAGRGGDHQIDAAIARARKDNMAAEMLEMQIKEKAGQLIPVAKIEPFITNLIVYARQQLINLPKKWTHEIQAGVKPEELYFETDINDALNQLSNADPFGDEEDGSQSDENMGSTDEAAYSEMGD